MVCVYTARLGDYSAELAARYARALEPRSVGFRLEIFSASTLQITRRSPGSRKGYSSSPMYFFATLWMCSSAPSLGVLDHAALDLDPEVGVVPVRHREGHARVPAQVADPDPLLVAVQHDDVALDIYPGRPNLRSAVFAQCRDVAEVWLLEQITMWPSIVRPT